MLLLPSPPRRSHLRAFVLALGLAGGLALVGLLALGLTRWGLGLGMGLCLATASVGLAWPNLFRSPYYAWNRLSGHYLRGVRWSIKTLCFLILVILHQRVGSPLRLDTGPPQWTARAPSDTFSVAEVGQPDWRAAYVAWARGTGKWWALSLLPFLMVLAALDQELEPVLPSQTYTLF
jgi:hypothetical protein